MEWVSVKTNLPPNDNEVLACGLTSANRYQKYKQISIGYLLGRHWMLGDSFIQEVTHWQPLPSPPEELKNEEVSQ